MASKRLNSFELPVVFNTPCFLYWIGYYMKRFQAINGRHHWLKHDGSYEKWRQSGKSFGRWLKEYQRMDMQGLFTPEQLQELYKPILEGTSKLTFIYRDAIKYICSQAQDMAEEFLTKQVYEIRTVTRVIALDDNDRELVGLTLNYALKTCKAMNEEAEEELFKVYNSKVKKFMAKEWYDYPTF